MFRTTKQKCDSINTPSYRAWSCFRDVNRRGRSIARASRSLLPDSWQPVQPLHWAVPGVALAAWAGLMVLPWFSTVLFQFLEGTAAQIADALANRLENLPGLRIVVKRTESVGGTPAARIEVVAPGTGDAIASSGTGTVIAAPEGKSLVPTHQVTVGFVRPSETLYVVWHMPESSHDRITPDIDTMLRSFRFTSSGKL